MTADLVPAATSPYARAEALREEFLATRKDRVNTHDAYTRDLRSWLDWCIARNVDPLDAWPAHCARWQTELAQGDPATDRKAEAGTTRARRLGAVSAWYRWLIRHQAAPRNPALLEGAERPVRAPRRAPALSAEQAEKLLAAADTDTPRAAAIVFLMIYGGLRSGELIEANVGDIGMTDGELILNVRGKGGKTREVRVNPVVWQRLTAYLAARPDATALPVPAAEAGAGKDRPLIATYRGNRIDRKQIRLLLRRLATEAGLPEQVVDNLRPHSTRATYATRSIAAGLDVRAVQGTMGHASLDTTVGYDRSKVTPDRDPAIRLLSIIRPPDRTNPEETPNA